MPKQIVFPIVVFLHDLFTAVWIGGLITLGVTVLPAARKTLGMGPQTKDLLDTIQKRLSVLVYVCIVGLILTGLLMANRSAAFQGLFSFGNTYSALLSVKHILVIAMVIVALARSLFLGRQQGAAAQKEQKFKAILLYLNIILGVVVLLLSGFCAAFSAGPPVG